MTNVNEARNEGVTQSHAWACEQALASAKIEGFKETPGFTANFEDLRAGRITTQEFRARETARILATVKANG